MKKLIRILTFTILIAVSVSCVYDRGYYVAEISFAERSPWEHASGIPLWYRITYLDGEGISEFFIPAHAKGCRIEIPKGYPCIAAAYPMGELAPLGICREPGTDGSVFRFTSDSGDIAETLLAYREEFSDLLERLDYDELVSNIWESTGGKPWAADWGELYYGLLFSEEIPEAISMDEFHPVKVEGVSPGYWIADCRGIPVATSSVLHRTVYLSLPQGIFHLYNPDCHDYIIRVEVADDGSYESEIRPFPVNF